MINIIVRRSAETLTFWCTLSCKTSDLSIVSSNLNFLKFEMNFLAFFSRQFSTLQKSVVSPQTLIGKQNQAISAE